jgi:putative salt-induced outer membrane protein YdiY
MSQTRHRVPLCLAFALFALLLPVAAWAQAQAPAPPAPAPAPPPPPPPHEGSANFAFVGTTGNTSTETLGLGAEFIDRPAPAEARFKVGYIRDLSHGDLTAESFTTFARIQRPVKKKLSVYGQYTYLHDRFAGIDSRNVIEAGLSYAAIGTAVQKLVFDGGLGYNHESRVNGDTISTATFGTGGLYIVNLSKTSDFSEDGHFVFSLTDGANWHYDNVAAVTAKITNVFSMKLSNTVHYINLPVPGFKKTNTITAIALVVKF